MTEFISFKNNTNNVYLKLMKTISDTRLKGLSLKKKSFSVIMHNVLEIKLNVLLKKSIDFCFIKYSN